jgi:hypothetical protein
MWLMMSIVPYGEDTYLPTIQGCLIGSKVFQLCNLMSGYVLEFMMYSGAGSDIATNL